MAPKKTGRQASSGAKAAPGKSEGLSKASQIATSEESRHDVLIARIRDDYEELKRKDFDSNVLAKIEFADKLESLLWPTFVQLVRREQQMPAEGVPQPTPPAVKKETKNQRTAAGKSAQPAETGDHSTAPLVTPQHVLFLMMIVNEKRRQRMNTWRFLEANPFAAPSSPLVGGVKSSQGEDVPPPPPPPAEEIPKGEVPSDLGPASREGGNDDQDEGKPRVSGEQYFGAFFYRVVRLFNDSLRTLGTSAPSDGEDEDGGGEGQSGEWGLNFVWSLKERAQVVSFFIYCFQSLEKECIRNACLSICGMPLWFHISATRRSMILRQDGNVSAAWRKVQRHYKKLPQQQLQAPTDKSHEPTEDAQKEKGDLDMTSSASAADEAKAAVGHLSEVSPQKRSLLNRDFLVAVLETFLEFIRTDPVWDALITEEFSSEDEDGNDDQTMHSIPTVDNATAGASDSDREVAVGGADEEDKEEVAKRFGSRRAMGGRGKGLRLAAQEGASGKLSPKALRVKTLADTLLYVERLAEFLADLLSQLPTRRFILPVITYKQVVARCLDSKAVAHAEGGLFKQLSEILDFYENFEINDLTGEPLTFADIEAQHYDRFHQFQRVCFLLSRDITLSLNSRKAAISAKETDDDREDGGEDGVNPEVELQQEMATLLKSLSLSPVSAVNSPAKLAVELRKLPLATLREVCSRMDLSGRETANRKSKRAARDDINDALREDSAEALMHLLVHYLARRPDQLQKVNEMPLFPTENLLWDPNLVPAEHYRGDFSLALPKLNLQFLTIHDYLLRNFNLFRLESTYEIRENLEDAIYRMNGYLSSDATSASKTKFQGSWRMATPITSLAIMSIKPPKLGRTTPSEVRAEVTLSLRGMQHHVRMEWETIRQHEALFLVAVVAPLNRDRRLRPQDLARLEDFQGEFGVVGVRGCELVEIVDEEGNSLTDRNPTETFEPVGEARTFRVFLDPEQYQLDVHTMATTEGMEDFYGTFNLLVRRKPEENNFKPILHTIRQMMNNKENTVVPDWLHDIFLGYGEPAMANYKNLSSQLSTIDFLDTFLDKEHLVASFPGARIQASSSSESPSVDDFKIPCRLKFDDLRSGEQMPIEDRVMNGGDEKGATPSNIVMETYSLANRGPYPECRVRHNQVRFTPRQVECIRSGVNPGLTVVVGPPGTGKTDTAVQIINLLHHNFPEQRTLVVAHSNLALNDLFEKIVHLDIDERYLLRLGMGERELQMASDDVMAHTAKGRRDFSKWGRVNFMLQRRKDLLSRVVERLAGLMNVPGDVWSTCETAEHFYHSHVLSAIASFRRGIAEAGKDGRGLKKVLLRLKREAASPGPKADDYVILAAKPGEDDRALPQDDSVLRKRKRKRVRAPKPGKERPTSGNAAGGKEGEAAISAATDAEIEDATMKMTSTAGDPQKPEREKIPELTEEEISEKLRGGETTASILFPFHIFFSDAPQPLFPPDGSYDSHLEIAEGCFKYLQDVFGEIAECRAFELLRTMHDRATFLLTKHAKVIAMTCTHAALTRQTLVDSGFKYDTLVMEEAAQILEVETFIPMLLQQSEKEMSRLKRVILIGDHHQLPPVVKNQGFQQYGNLDQSLFHRFVRLGVPHVQLDMQGRARPSLAKLFSWRYAGLGNLPLSQPEYKLANAGMAFPYQFIDVADYQGRGESAPLPFFYQNLGEAETAVGLFMYLRLAGYPASRITMLSTYNGQRQLIRDIIEKRCGWNPAIGWPARVTTVDRYQGQQNDIVIISLVRTATVGHIRDVRRLIVAVSRARLGLYLIGRRNIFEPCHELRPVLSHFLQRPTKLAILPQEKFPTNRAENDAGTPLLVQDVDHLFQVVQAKAAHELAAIQQAAAARAAAPAAMAPAAEE